MQSAKVTGASFLFYKQCADMESAFATDNQMCSCPIECVLFIILGECLAFLASGSDPTIQLYA